MARQRRINNRMSCSRERVFVTGGFSSRNISEENAMVSFGRFFRRCSRTGSATAARAARNNGARKAMENSMAAGAGHLLATTEAVGQIGVERGLQRLVGRQ